MNVIICTEKFGLVIKYLFEGKIVVTPNDIEQIVKALEDSSDQANSAKSLLETSQFCNLIIHAVDNIHNASTTVKEFIIQIATVYFKNDLQFNIIPINVLLTSCIKCLCTLLDPQQDIPARLHLACIKLATSLMLHCPSIAAIIEKKLWVLILHQNIHHKSVPVARAAYTFISTLTWKLNEHKLENYVAEVLEFVVAPIRTTGYKEVKTIDSKIEELLSDKIYSNLHALLVILKETDKLVTVNYVMPILKRLIFFDQGLYVALEACRNPETVYLVNECFVRIGLAVLTANHLHGGRSQDYCTEVLAYFRNSISIFTHRDTKMALHIVVCWNLILYDFKKSFQTVGLPFDTKFERNGQDYDLFLQTIVLFTAPLITYSVSLENPKAIDLVEEFRSKMGKIITEHILSCGYLLKTALLRHDLKQIVIQTLREIFLLRGRINAAQAGILFQSLFYILNTFISLDESGGLILNENPTECLDDIKLLTLLFDGIKMLLVDHNIYWYETVEIINLQAGLLNMLKQNTLTVKQIMQVLDLIDICVKKFLSPNMTLLVEKKQDSTLNEIGAVIKTYIQHEDWGVRDSALNLLLSCTDICFVKYIPLQRVIIENNLMIFAAKIAVTEPDCYPQSTALKCMAATCKIGAIWRDVLIENPHFYLQLVYILQHNQEAMVRKEAANTLTKIYNNHKLTPSFKITLYEIMIKQALDDLDCEVQLAALNFWKQVIQCHLTYRGMIDGSFPAVTFSKEKRKIVVLTDTEILKQLTSIMDDLSSIGVLTVLLKAMDEINHVEVMAEAYKMAKQLIKTLNKYKFETQLDTETIVETQSHRIKEDPMPDDLAEPVTNDDKRDKVIDSILELSQSDLLISIHDNYSDTIDVKDEDYTIYVPRKEIVKPNQFLEAFKRNDVLSKINTKKNFDIINSRSIEVLIDDILQLLGNYY